MSAGTIATNSQRAFEAAQLLTDQLDSYCSFSAKATIYDAAPVSGSAIHDELAAQLQKALSGWQTLMYSDANDIIGSDTAFKERDNSIAVNFLG